MCPIIKYKWLERRTGIFFSLLTQLYRSRSHLRGSFFIWFRFRSSHIRFISYAFVNGTIVITFPFAWWKLACVAGVRKGRGRKLGRETSRALRVSLAPKTPFPKTPFPFPFKRLPRRLGENNVLQLSYEATDSPMKTMVCIQSAVCILYCPPIYTLRINKTWAY